MAIDITVLPKRWIVLWDWMGECKCREFHKRIDAVQFAREEMDLGRPNIRVARITHEAETIVKYRLNAVEDQ